MVSSRLSLTAVSWELTADSSRAELGQPLLHRGARGGRGLAAGAEAPLPLRRLRLVRRVLERRHAVLGLQLRGEVDVGAELQELAEALRDDRLRIVGIL